ncbi:transcription antiterminator [Pediococcus acidilactici]|nr:PRD domain-containing protein [Pediococcus acidilactici]RJF53664.1 transcription antiterminator [Pediococcus acidilactici]
MVVAMKKKVKRVDKKETQIIYSLAKSDAYVTSNQLASLLHVSNRSIIRMIKRINSNTGGELVRSKKGRGYKLNYEAFLRNAHILKNFKAYSPIERRKEVLLKLLFKSPEKVGINTLFENFYISESVVSTDIAILKQQLNKKGVLLINRDRTLRVQGNESTIRKLIIRLVNKWEVDDYSSIGTEIPNLAKRDRDFVVGQMDYIEHKLRSPISFPYNVNLFYHLCILIKRYKSKNIKFEFGEPISTVEKEMLENNQKLSAVAGHIVDTLGDYISLKMPPIEKYYIFQYLNSARLISESKDKELKFINLTRLLLKNISEILKITIQGDGIEEDLSLHVEPMFKRIINGIEIKNPILEDIKLEYPNIFQSTEIAMKKIFREYYSSNVSDDEIGFVAIYIAKFIEQHGHNMKALIMCSSGIGTSELLKVKIEKELPNLVIEDVISFRMYEKNKEKWNRKVDLILTTIATNEKVVDKPIVLVNAMFTKIDKIRVEKLIERLSQKNGKDNFKPSD